MDNNEKALKQYNAKFNNDAYEHLKLGVSLSFKDKEKEEDAIVDIMNMITDVAMALCGYKFENRDPFKTLITNLADYNRINAYTLVGVELYLKEYKTSENTLEFHDLMQTIGVVRRINPAKAFVEASAAKASDIHSWQGNFAYKALSAMGNMLVVLNELLIGNEDTYPKEKLELACLHWDLAIIEGEANGFAIKKPTKSTKEGE